MRESWRLKQVFRWQPDASRVPKSNLDILRHSELSNSVQVDLLQGSWVLLLELLVEQLLLMGEVMWSRKLLAA